MELKLKAEARTQFVNTRSNRTFMELKRVNCTFIKRNVLSSNRTFMELKR